jgi:G3E family GTPase
MDIVTHHFFDNCSNSEGVENESVEQLCFADRVLLNKTDLVDGKTLTQIEMKVKELNPSASIIRCQYSKVDPKELLNIEAFNLKRVLEFEPDFLADDQEHQHDQSVSSVSCRVKGNLNQE